MENHKVIKNIVLTLLNTFDTDEFLTETESDFNVNMSKDDDKFNSISEK